MSSLQCNLDLLKIFGKILMIFSFLGRFWWFFSILGQFWWFFNIWCLSIFSKKIFHFLGISIPISMIPISTIPISTIPISTIPISTISISTIPISTKTHVNCLILQDLFKSWFLVTGLRRYLFKLHLKFFVQSEELEHNFLKSEQTFEHFY